MSIDDRVRDEGHAEAIGLHHVMRALDDEDPTSLAIEPATDEPAIDDPDSIAAIRARLAARGLVVGGPAVIVPNGVRPERPVVLDDVLAEAEGDHHPNAVPEDDWDVVSEGGQLVSVRCPQCNGTQLTPIDVTRFRCAACERAWRWAVCESCDEVGFAVERQESWRCRCSHFTRAWWRTDVARREAHVIVARRRDLTAQADRALVRAGMRKRRWKIIAGGVAGLLLVLVFVASVRSGEKGPAVGTAETCRQFERLRSDLGSGTLDAAELDASLARLADAASIADTPVHDAATQLAAVGSPSKAAFLIAQTDLADACTAFNAKR